MKRVFAATVLLLLACIAPATRNQRSELDAVYRNMQKSFANKDIRGYSAYWAPAIRWFPPRRASTTMSTKPRAQLLRDLRTEFSGKDKVALGLTVLHFDADPERAVVDLAILVTHVGVPELTRSFSERHHWLKAGGRWWLSRIEAVN